MTPREPGGVGPVLGDVIRAAELIQVFTLGMTFADYQSDEKTRAAVEREFIIVGEALSTVWKMEAALAEKVTALREIIAFRNKLVHGYQSIHDELVWEIITDDVPRLTNEVKALLATLPDPQTPA